MTRRTVRGSTVPAVPALSPTARLPLASLSPAVERLQKMIDDGSVKPNKKEQFGRRLNILSSFQ